MLLPFNFKIFNSALSKTTLFLLERQLVSTSLNEEFVKKRFHLREKLFSPPECLIDTKNGFSLARKAISTRSNEIFL